jgi:hypothetical protein
MSNTSKKFTQELLTNCPPPTGPLFGSKEAGNEKRANEAKKITEMLFNSNEFCFLRMGDAELRLLLSLQFEREDELVEQNFSDGPFGGTISFGNPGLSGKHLKRLWAAYENADYVDFHEGNWPNEHLVPLLKIERPPGTLRNPDKDSSLVFFAWLEYEFRDYCEGKRVGFVGAEARLLELLLEEPEFSAIAEKIWPKSAQVYFHQARDNGRNLDANLDLVKDDVKKFILSNKLDIVFISLGGGAKIIAYELSRELKVKFFDFGSLTRALTYSGSGGNRFSRSMHYPYFYRVPFLLYMRCLVRAMPELAPEELLAKAHGQLIQEVVKKEYGWSHASWEYEFNSENISYFRKSYRGYKKKYSHLFKISRTAKKERADFLHFCGKHNLTLEGRLFYALFQIKGMLKCLFYILKNGNK